MKSIVKFFVLAVALLSMTACINDLKVESIDPNQKSDINADLLLGKIYSTLGTTGQKGPDGDGDLDGIDEGTSSLFRMTFNLNEFPSDQIYWIWPDVGVDDIRKASWTASNALVRGAYCRCIFDITLCNLYLEDYGENDPVKTAEVRFIRALNYWYLLDLIGNVPFNITAEEMAAYDKKDQLRGTKEDKPKQILRANLYDWLVKEVLSLKESLSDVRPSYYRVDKTAADMLLARLYLNAEVYSGKADWDNAAKSAYDVISSNYQLASKYEYLFMGDNDNLSAVNDAHKEIILPVAQDGQEIQSWGGSLYLIASYRSDGMPSWGITESWKCMRTRKNLVQLFIPNVKSWNVPTAQQSPELWKSNGSANHKAIQDQMAKATSFPWGDHDVIRPYAKDQRAMLLNYREYNDSLFIVCNCGRENTDDAFFSGWLCTKFSNLMADPSRVAHDTKHPDMDLILMRKAEAYLTYAEAVLRGGASQGMTAQEAINVIRNRAQAEHLDITLDNILDEWGREFWGEGRRRIDLVRFGKFTGDNYAWEWKGGNQFGQVSIDAFRSIYPIPYSDLTANENLEQNEGYAGL